MAGRIESGGGDDRLELAPQQGDFARALGIGRGGEQPDDAELARQLAARIEELHAHVVHRGAAMDGCAHVGLGDDESRGLHEEAADLRRHGDQLFTALQHMGFGSAQKAQSRILDRHEIAARHAAIELVLAHAEKGEVIVGEPHQEGDRFGELRDGNRRRVGPVGVDRLGQPRLHDAPVEDGGAHVGENLHELACELAELAVGHPAQMDVDQALADGSRRR